MALPTAPTYSVANAGGTLVSPFFALAVTGGNFNATKVHEVPDTSDAGYAMQNPKINFGGYQQVMAKGDSFLFKDTDGATKRGVFDAERSTPANPVVRKL